MRGDFAGDPVGTVVADQRNHVAAPDSEFDEAEREIAHAVQIVRPGEAAPQAEILLPQRHRAAVLAGIEPKQLRKRVGLGDAGGVVDHAVASVPLRARICCIAGSSCSPR